MEASAAVAGQATSTGGAVRLVRIDKADYSKLVEGKDEIFPETQLWRFGTSLYAVTKKGSDWVIGRFDPETLELKASSAPVTPGLSPSPKRMRASSADVDIRR